MLDVTRRLRDWLEGVVPWFDRASEERWRVGFERDLASSRETRALADRELGRQALMRSSFFRAGDRLGRGS